MPTPISTRYLKWASACGEYGKINMIPTLWIYSENDYSIPPEAAQPMFKSFQDKGGKGTFVMKPKYGTNGHFICEDPGLFWVELSTFFNTIGMVK